MGRISARNSVAPGFSAATARERKPPKPSAASSLAADCEWNRNFTAHYGASSFDNSTSYFIQKACNSPWNHESACHTLCYHRVDWHRHCGRGNLGAQQDIGDSPKALCG